MKMPKIRFKGYTDVWEQRKLGELSNSFEYGLNAAAKEFDGKNKYIRITDIDDDTRTYLDTDITSPDAPLDNASNYLLQNGDIVFARTGASVGKTYIYRDSDGLIYYAGFLIRARIKPEYSAEFIFQNTLTSDYERFIRITSQRSGQPGVNAQEYADYTLYVPKIAEQQQIGTYFRNLDHLITLHQRKCEQVKMLKKYMLQKMFPQNGSNVPEIRFEGFTDAWEQRKLGEIAIEVKRKAEKDSIAPVMMISASDGFIEQSQRYSTDNAGSSLKNYTLLYEGELAYNHGYSKVRNFGSVFDLKVKEARIPFVYHSFALPEDDHCFFAYYLNSGLFDGELKKLVSSTARMDGLLNISFEDYMSLEILRPSKAEQEKIGVYLTNLDNLITLHQRKCDKLQNLKKFMLQNMFA